MIFTLAAILVALFPASGTAQTAGAKISAVYRIEIGGIKLGNFKFNSEMSGSKYALQSRTKLSFPIIGALFKSLRWKGQSSSSGRIRGGKAQPTSYDFAFKNGKKRGRVQLKFSGSRVTKIVSEPRKKPKSSMVPVTKAHLAGVVDPMSAVMNFLRKGQSHRSACSGRIPIFDGKHRFDLYLSYKKTKQLRRTSAGYSGPAVVCRVKYKPISGYKPSSKQTKFFASTNGIEIWLIPLPDSRNYALYYINLPTPIGTATVTASNFQIDQPGGRRIALVRR